MSNRLSGKVAVVSGASKGIGAAIARHLAAEGASVVVNYASDKAGADRTVAAITENGGTALAVQADFSKQEQIQHLFAQAKETFHRLDILVNNAGVFEFAPVEGITPKHFYRQYDLNVLGLLLASREASAYFDDAGGSIINIGSVVSTAAPAGSAVYSSTKAAVDAVTKVLAKELGPRQIRVNSVNPGMVETEGYHTAGIPNTPLYQKVIEETPLGRIGQPDDIARVVVFFASSDSAWVTGETLQVSGGNR